MQIRNVSTAGNFICDITQRINKIKISQKQINIGTEKFNGPYKISSKLKICNKNDSIHLKYPSYYLHYNPKYYIFLLKKYSLKILSCFSITSNRTQCISME